MATFTSAWRSYGSGASMRAVLVLTDPVVNSGTTSVIISATLYIETSSSISDSFNQNTLSGSINASDPNKAVSHGSGGGTTAVCSSSVAVAVVYGSTTTVTVTGTLSNYEIVSGSTSVTGSVVVPARPPGTPSAPGTPSVGTVGPTSCGLSWTAPSNLAGGFLSAYQLQVSPSSTFASGVVTYSPGTTASYTVPSLTPGTTYYARVRVSNGTNWSAWSGTRSFTTLSGAKIRVSGAWVDAPANVRSAGAWVTPVVNKRNAGAWVT